LALAALPITAGRDVIIGDVTCQVAIEKDITQQESGTVRGAAGASVLNAELMLSRGLL
jgi:Mg-chelatase subunit ChlI